MEAAAHHQGVGSCCSPDRLSGRVPVGLRETGRRGYAVVYRTPSLDVRQRPLVLCRFGDSATCRIWDVPSLFDAALPGHRKKADRTDTDLDIAVGAVGSYMTGREAAVPARCCTDSLVATYRKATRGEGPVLLGIQSGVMARYLGRTKRLREWC